MHTNGNGLPQENLVAAQLAGCERYLDKESRITATQVIGGGLAVIAGLTVDSVRTWRQNLREFYSSSEDLASVQHEQQTQTSYEIRAINGRTEL